MGNPPKLDHIALAVNSLDEAVKVYEQIGLTFTAEREVVKDQKVTTAFADLGDGSHLELLEPIGYDGPISKYLEKRGPGIHHICLKVDDVVAKTKELKAQGFQLIYDEPVVGAGNCLVNFIHPKSTGGVLVEISMKQGQ